MKCAVRRSASDLRLVVGAGVLALVAGCSSGSGDLATEPAIALADGSAPTATGLPDGSASDDGTADVPPADTTDDSSQEHDDATTDDDAIPVNSLTVVDESAEVEVDDQAGDGTTVQVEEVRVGSQPGFVVIHDAGRTVLGWAYVPSAVRGVTVTLATPVRASRELVASLFRDDGDRVFDPGVDRLVVETDDDDGEIEPVAEDFDYLLR